MKNKLFKLLLATAISASLLSCATFVVNAKNNDVNVQTTAYQTVDNSLGLFSASDTSVVSFEKNAKAPAYFFNDINPFTENGVISQNSIVYGPNDPLGLKINFTDDVVLNYNSPIYIGDLSAATPVFEFLVTPEKNDTHKQGTSETFAEFGGVEVTLTDYYDADKFVVFDIIYSTAYTWRSELKVYSKGMTPGGNRWGGLNVSSGFGTPVVSSFTGAINHTQAYFFDYQTNSISVYSNYRGGEDGDRMWIGNKGFVRDLDDPAWLVKGDTPFAGFTNGVVNLSIKLKGVTASKASLILTSICGQDLRGEDIIDNTPPSIIENNPLKENPSALVGEKFPINEVSSFDAVSGILTDDVYVEIYKKYGTLNSELVELRGDYFIPDTAEDYTITYNSTDANGNSSIFKRTVTAYDKLSDITVDYDGVIPTNALVGDQIEIPNYETYGGAGCINSTFEIINKTNGKNYELIGGKLVLDAEGLYAIKVDCVDYIGQKYTSVKYIDVDVPSKPIIPEIRMPKAFISNKTIYFPEIYATDYAISDNPTKTLCDVYVSENGGEWTKADGLKYKVKSLNGSFKVKFIASSSYSGAIVESNVYEIAIVKPTSCADYFYNADGNLTVDYVPIPDTTNEEALFKTSTDLTSFEYINVLPSNYFKVDFVTYTDEVGYANFDEIIITLTDSVNVNEKLTVKLTQVDNAVKLNLAGFQELNTSGNFKNGKVNFEIKNDNGVYSDTKFLTNIEKFDNGLPFTGFSSGKMYAEFTISKVSGNSAIYIKNLNDQTLFIKNLFDGFAPVINVNKPISLTCALGDRLIVPSAFSVDMLDPNTEVTVKVTDPLGKVLLNDVADKERFVVVDRFGIYKIEYKTQDDFSNVRVMPYEVNCEDTFNPVIEINGQFTETMKVGSKLIIPEINVTDNISTGLECYVFIETPTNYIENVEESYVFEKAGTYRLRFFAQDDSSNFTTLIFEIKVV